MGEPRFSLTLKHLAEKLISIEMEQIKTNSSTLGTITQYIVLAELSWVLGYVHFLVYHQKNHNHILSSPTQKGQ